MIIEKIVLDYLNDVLPVPAYMEMPKNPPTEFVLIEKTGSSLSDHLGNAIFAIQSHSDTLYKAAVPNDVVKREMLDIVVLDDIASCGLNSDYNFTDGAMKDYRYQAVFVINHY